MRCCFSLFPPVTQKGTAEAFRVSLLALKLVMEGGGVQTRRGGHKVAASSSCCPFSMSSPSLALLLLLLFSIFSHGALALNSTSTKRVSTLKLARIQRHLDRINKPAIRTIESPDGDIIDCVHRHKQPALDHPLLKNHKIQRVAPKMPSFRGGRGVRNYNASNVVRGAWQAWHHAGHCPRGTVPIRRSSVDDVLRAKSLYHYGKKQRRAPVVARSADAPDVVSGNGHELSSGWWDELKSETQRTAHLLQAKGNSWFSSSMNTQISSCKGDQKAGFLPFSY